MDSSSWKPGLKRGQLVSLMQDLPEVPKLSGLILFLLQQGLSDTSCVLVGNVLDAPHRRDRFLIGLMLVRGGWSSMILGVLSTIVQRGGSRHSVFNDHVKALWGAQNIRGKKTFLSNNSWLEVGGLAPLTYTVNCKTFACAGLFGACKQCYLAMGFEAYCTRDTKNHLFAPSSSLLSYLWGLWLLHFKSFKGRPAQHLSWARSCCRWGLPHTCRKYIFIIKQLTKLHHKQPSWDMLK